MELTIKTDTPGFVEAYLRIWNGGIKMTEKELSVMKYILLKYGEISSSGVAEPYLSELLFSANNLAALRKEFTLSTAGWYAVKKNLVNKGVILGGDILQVNPKLLPQKKITFKFEIDE